MPEGSTVSVVLPVRDGAAYLEEALASIFEQSVRDFELLVVDDGSTDATPEILARTVDARLRVLRGDRQGLVAALEQGLSEARSPYVARMDADDVADPLRLERQLELLDSRPRVGMVATWTTVIDAGGHELRRELLPTRHEDLFRRLLLRNPFTHGSVMLRRQAFLEAGGYRGDFGANEDYDLWRRLGARWELACVPELLYRYRLHTRAVTATDPNRVGRRESLRDEIWRAYPSSSYDVRGTIRAARRYRDLDGRVARDHAADQRALAREALERQRPALAARALVAALALSRA